MTDARHTVPLPLILLLLLLLLLGALPGHGLAADDDNSARLQQLRQQIQSLRSELDSDRQRKQSLQSRLRNTEKRIGKTAALLRELDRQIRRQKGELKALEKQRRGLRDDLRQHRIALGQQLRAAYANGQQEYLKILLSQQDPAAVARTLTYYDYYNRARLEKIRAIDEHLTELTAVEKKIRQQTRELERNRAERVNEKQQLERSRSERSQLLARLQQDMRSKDQRLSRLLEDERQLQRLLERLAEQPVKAPLELSEGKPFAQLRGKLIWPTAGRLTARFGQRRKVGKLRWQGVRIGAREGTEVRAIHHGRVVFSDWLRGFGLLTIIDHGDGYMSLYGGNQSLYKEEGDWVESGEVIAAVGNSGGNDRHALYFEIRHNGKPVNPLKWCRGKPKKMASRR